VLGAPPPINTPGAPAPIYYYKFETGDEGVIEPIAATGKEIYTHRVYYSHTNYEAALDNFLIHLENTCIYLRSINSPGTIVIDTMTEFYELSRFFHFGGRLNQVQQAYTPVNVDMKEAVRLVDGAGVNGVFINRMGRSRDEKVTMPDGSIVGAPYTAGWSGLGYEMQVMLRVERIPDEPQLGEAVRYLGYIAECRQKGALIGNWLEGTVEGVDGGVLRHPLSFDYLLRWVHA
jgi:hypothetical protein